MSESRSPSLYLPDRISAAVRALRPASGTPKWVIDDLHHAGRLVIGNTLEADSVRAVIRSGLPKRMWDQYADLERKRRDRYPGTSHLPLLSPLANILGRARRFGPEARLTSRQRRTRALAIEEHAENLLAILKPMEDGESYPEWYVYGYGGDRSRILAHSLGDLAEGARKWSKPRGAFVLKPSMNNADRTYFVKTLARLLQNRYGNKCPGLIASLAKVFFPERQPGRRGVEGLIRG